METFFNIRYEFDKAQIHAQIDARLKKPGSDYICVADGVILNTANRRKDYLDVINGGLFAICDSSMVPVYIRWIYKIRKRQYSGCEIFKNLVSARKYRMIFLGTDSNTLTGLKNNLKHKYNPDVENMKFIELPFRKVKDFDYPSIAKLIENDGAEIVWIALGAPKQEYFMHSLKPYLNHGVMLGVGAVFKFYSGGISVNRAPKWMVRHHMEFIHRLLKEPKKQIPRCFHIIRTLPKLLLREWLSSKKIKVSQ